MKKCERCENCVKHRFDTDRVLILDQRTDSYRTRDTKAIHNFFWKKLQIADIAILIDENGNNKAIKNRFDAMGVSLTCPTNTCPELRLKKLKRILGDCLAIKYDMYTNATYEDNEENYLAETELKLISFEDYKNKILLK